MKKKKIDTENSLIYKSMSMEDLAEIMPCIERDGYFSDTPDFSEYFYGQLTEVYASYHHEYAFYGEGVGFKTAFKYFIPKLSVVFEKKEKKKLRPFKDISEFCSKTGCLKIGQDLITIRDKNTNKEGTLRYNGFFGETIHLGGFIFTFDGLLREYEYSNGPEWKPFGIEVNE